MRRLAAALVVLAATLGGANGQDGGLFGGQDEPTVDIVAGKGPGTLAAPESTDPRRPPALMKIIGSRRGFIQACLVKAQQTQPELAGILKVAFTIRKDGKVAHAAADASSTITDKKLIACVVKQFKGMVFAKAKLETRLKFPLRFVATKR